MLPRARPDTLLALRPSLHEPARVRGLVADYLLGCSRHTHDDAMLLVSELVTNVIRHGALPATVSLNVVGDLLHVVVADCGPPLPEQPSVVDVASTSGRGLIIVSSIALAWGVSTTPGQVGKEIWFDLAVSC